MVVAGSDQHRLPNRQRALSAWASGRMSALVLWTAAFAVIASVATASAADRPAAPRGQLVLAGDYSTHRLALIDDQGEMIWQHEIRDIHDAWRLPNGNILFQTDWQHVIEQQPDGKVVWQYDARQGPGNRERPVEIHAFQRLPNGRTMIAESGPARILEIAADGSVQATVPLTVERPDPHRDTRLVRKLDTGHYLVAHEGDGAVREYDPKGTVVWEYHVGTPVYSAERLENGNTLIGSGGGHSVLEVSPEKKVVWSIGEQDLPGHRLAWVTMVERLPNGNTFVVNCHAGPEQPQLLEVTPDKQVVWSFHDFERFGNSLPVARLLKP